MEKFEAKLAAEKKAKEKANAPADRVIKKLDAFCKKNNIHLFGAVSIPKLDRNIVRSFNCPDNIYEQGLIRTIEQRTK